MTESSAPSATWLYAVAPTTDEVEPAGVTGVAGEEIRVVEAAGLSAVVGSVPLSDFAEEPLHSHLEDLRWLEEAVRAHHRVIGTAVRDARVLPLRFATLYTDDERVRCLLEEHRAAFASALERVAGRIEWGVKAYADPRSFLPEPADERADGTGERPGTAYLLRRRAQRSEQETARLRAARRAEEIHAALAGLAAETAEHPPQDARLAEYEGWMVLNNSYLVPDPRTAEFAAAVAALRERFPGIRLELSGPWPPYSFTGSTGAG